MPSYEVDLHKLEGYNTQVLGISVDHIPCLKAWAESLGGITYPLLSDFWPHGAVAELYGVLREGGTAERALFIVDKAGIVRFVDIHDSGEQPDNEDLFRVLRELEPTAVIPDKAVRQTGPGDVQQSASARLKPIVLYCRPGCIDCRLARRFLESNNVPYSEVNVLASRDAEAKVRGWTGGPLISPVFDIEGTIVVDFKRDELIAALGLR